MILFFKTQKETVIATEVNHQLAIWRRYADGNPRAGRLLRGPAP